MDYVGHVLKTAPVLYFPMDDVVASGGARNLGSLGGVVGTYGATAKRMPAPVDGPGVGRGGAGTVSSGSTLMSTTGFQSGTTATGWSVAWWQKIGNYSTMPGGSILVAPAGGYTDPTSTGWLFLPFTDGLCYFYGPSGALMRAGFVYPGKRGMWEHWAFAWSAATQTLYRNGVIVWSQNVALTSAGNAAAAMSVGVDIGCGQCHVAYWNRTITQAEVKQLVRVRGT